jgi:hypothetical protein
MIIHAQLHAHDINSLKPAAADSSMHAGKCHVNAASGYASCKHAHKLLFWAGSFKLQAVLVTHCPAVPGRGQ